MIAHKGALHIALSLLVAVAIAHGVIASTTPASGGAEREAVPIFGIKVFPGYRDWKLISVAHEEGNLNDIRAILGNDIAIMACRKDNASFKWLLQPLLGSGLRTLS